MVDDLHAVPDDPWNRSNNIIHLIGPKHDQPVRPLGGPDWKRHFSHAPQAPLLFYPLFCTPAVVTVPRPVHLINFYMFRNRRPDNGPELRNGRGGDASVAKKQPLGATGFRSWWKEIPIPRWCVARVRLPRIEMELPSNSEKNSILFAARPSDSSDRYPRRLDPR